MKQNPFLEVGAANPKVNDQRDDHIQFLFQEINDWFFGNDTTSFDPEYLESIEEFYEKRGFLTDAQYAGLQNIYNQFVCN